MVLYWIRGKIMGWPFNVQLSGGQSLKAISADNLETIFNILDEIEGVNIILDKTANGKQWKITANFDDTDFSVTGENSVITTNGASGTTLNGDVVVNGLIKSIGA